MESSKKLGDHETRQEETHRESWTRVRSSIPIDLEKKSPDMEKLVKRRTSGLHSPLDSETRISPIFWAWSTEPVLHHLLTSSQALVGNAKTAYRGRRIPPEDRTEPHKYRYIYNCCIMQYANIKERLIFAKSHSLMRQIQCKLLLD